MVPRSGPTLVPGSPGGAPVLAAGSCPHCPAASAAPTSLWWLEGMELSVGRGGARDDALGCSPSREDFPLPVDPRGSSPGPFLSCLMACSWLRPAAPRAAFLPRRCCSLKSEPQPGNGFPEPWTLGRPSSRLLPRGSLSRATCSSASRLLLRSESNLQTKPLRHGLAFLDLCLDGSPLPLPVLLAPCWRLCFVQTF